MGRPCEEIEAAEDTSELQEIRGQMRDLQLLEAESKPLVKLQALTLDPQPQSLLGLRGLGLRVYGFTPLQENMGICL